MCMFLSLIFFFLIDWDALEENARQADERKLKRTGDFEEEPPRKKGRR